MSSSQPRIAKLRRGRGRGRTSHSHHSQSEYITNTLLRGRGRGGGRGRARVRGRGRGRGSNVHPNNNNQPSPTTTTRGRRGRGRGRGRGTSIIKNIQIPDTTKPSKRSSKGPKRQKNQAITSRASHFSAGQEVKEWQKTPTIVLREWCQQHKRQNPRFVRAYIHNDELESFSKRYGIPIQNAASKAHRRRVILPDKGNDRSKDLTFCSKEVYKTQRHSEHMTSLLALHALCPSLPLERKLPDLYRNIWSSFSTNYHKVHCTSKFKSKKEQQAHESNKTMYKKKRERQRKQWEYERFADLNRVHMNEDLREYIQSALRQQYMEIHEENLNSGKDVGFSMFMAEDVDEKLVEIEHGLGKIEHAYSDKINKFLEIMIEKLCSLGFKKKDCKKATYLTAGIDFISCAERVNEFVSSENCMLSDGTKVVKAYKVNDYEINVDKYLADGVTWLCLHLKENELPRKYAAKGKQFEISVVNHNALGFNNNGVVIDNSDDMYLTDDIPKGTYFWLVQFGFPKKITVEYIRDYKKESKYVMLGKLYEKLISHIGNSALKQSLVLDVTEMMLEESDAAVESELQSLPFMFDDINCKELNNDQHKDYMWSKTFKFKHGCVGILEIYRIIKCCGFICYPTQIPLITFRSPNNTISPQQCQQIMQCLISQAQNILAQEMSFTLINWIQDNVEKLLQNPKQYPTLKLDKNWGNKQQKNALEEKKEPSQRSQPKLQKKKQKTFGRTKLFNIQKEKTLKRNKEKDIYLFERRQDKQKYNKKYQQYVRLRQALPAFACKDKIIQLMQSHQVLVISGETGCGKSTQIPQYILDHYITQGQGSVCNIICTQPRRISAVGLADRVSTERCERVGETVGYSIRLENRCSDQTQLLYCTTGILLRRLMTSLKIQSVTHVIIDEVHERSVDIDFLLVILKFLCEKRTELKLVLMSATLNAELFSKYFGGCPILEIPGRTYPVQTFFLEDLLHQSRISLPKTRWSKILQAEERIRYKQLKEKMENKNNNFKDRVFHQLCKWDERDNHRIEVALIVDTIFHILKRYPIDVNDKHSAILVFLPGMYEIKKSQEMFTQLLQDKELDLSLFWVIPLHSSLATTNQKQIFKTAPPGIRKIVLATNIAETSITINDVKYVIDGGKMKQMSFDPHKQISVLAEIWISIAHSKQRQGRAGRVGPGYCYKLYSRDKYINMREAPVPELLRSQLENVSLQIKLLRTLSLFNKSKSKSKNKSDVGGIKSILTSCIEPPSGTLIESSLSSLREVGALDENELLTPLGFHLSKLPVSNVRLAKMLIFASIFKCLTPCLIIAAILTTGKSIYFTYGTDLSKREMANKIKKKYYENSTKSDHITMYKFFVEWKRNLLFYTKRGARQFAFDNCLSHPALEQIDGITKQYKSALKEIGFIDATYSFENSVISMDHCSDINSKSYKLIKAILTAGLYPNCIRIKLPKKKYDKTLTGYNETDISDSRAIKFYLHPRFNQHLGTNGRIFIHGQSCLKSEISFQCNWLIYLTKIESRNRLQVYDLSMTTPYSLLFFGGKIDVDHQRQHIIIDNWIRFIAPSRIAVLVNELKKMCDYLLMKKIENPMTHIENQGVVKAIERLLKTDGLE